MKFFLFSCLLLSLFQPKYAPSFETFEEYKRQRQIKSSQMIQDLRREIVKWPFNPMDSEENALNGIQRLIKLNSSHPITEGVSLVHFIKQKHIKSETVEFGSTKVKWPYHCCIGFRDMYVDRSWFIDLSYHLMVNDSALRLVTKEQYLHNIPDSVNTFSVRLGHLYYFINLLGIKEHPTMTLDEFMKMNDRPLLMSMFDSHAYPHNIFDIRM